MNNLPIKTLSDWTPSSEEPGETAAVKNKPEIVVNAPCYCGAGLPFRLCCGKWSIPLVRQPVRFREGYRFEFGFARSRATTRHGCASACPEADTLSAEDAERLEGVLTKLRGE